MPIDYPCDSWSSVKAERWSEDTKNVKNNTRNLSVTLPIFLTFLILGAALAPGQQIITTMAGSAVASCGALGDGGPATSAQLCNAQQPVVDGQGNVYFYDFGNHRIRQVAPNGIITTIAGNGTEGTAGDGGPALSANLGVIDQLAWSNAAVVWNGVSAPALGQLCFADQLAYKVRCVSLDTGMIQGYGTGLTAYGGQGDGGPFSGATFNDPVGVAFDGAGNLYISDFSDQRVRMVNAALGTIATFAGPGPGYCCAPVGDGGPATSANLYEPMGLAYANGMLYISDTGNVRVRQVNLGTNIITTVAGNGTYGSVPDGSLATSGAVSTRWIAVDNSGDLFLGGVREVNTSGIIDTIAGVPGVSGLGSDYIPATQTYFSGVNGTAWDPIAQRLLISDQSRVRQIFFTPPTTTTLTSSQNPAQTSAVVTLQATVSPSTATGSVGILTGYNGGSYATLIGSEPLINGVATFSWTAPASAGTTLLTAAYEGDAADNLSLSATISEAVQQTTATTTTVTSSANPSIVGATVTFTAAVTPATATGTIQFMDGATLLSTATLAGGVASFSISTLAQGTHSITAVYSGDANDAASTSAALTQTVNPKTTTTTTVTSSANPSIVGATVTFTAAVTPATATGTIQFMDGATLLSTATLAGGVASFSISTLAQGTHSITAVYSGDANDATSTSAVLTQIVNVGTTTTLVSSANPITLGGSATFTATVTPAAATGTIQFTVYNSGNLMSSVTVPLAGGTAAWNAANLSSGANTVTAIYSGDSTYNTSTSAQLTEMVRFTSYTNLSSSVNPSVAGAAVVLTATLAPANSGQTGSVQFFNGGALLGTATVTAGVAQFTTTSLPAGADSLTAVYSGDTYWAPSTSSAIQQTVKAATTTTVTSSANPATVGTAVTFSAAVSPSTATGTLQFFDGTTLLGAPAMVNGAASYSATLAVGVHSITAVYSGDANNAASTSAVLTETINVKSTTTTLTSSINPSAVGSSVTLAATVSSGTGSVQFLDGANSLGSVTLASGSAQLVVTTFTQGVHSLTAVYSGDANDAPSTSAVYTQTVKLNANTSVASSPNPSVVGQSVTITATVAAGATGTVQFLDGSTVLGSSAVSGGTAALTTANLAQGTHTLTASYSGDSNYLAQSSAAITQTVTPKTPTTTTIASSSNPSIVGQSVTFTASVSPSAATGSVQFLDGTTVLATVTVNSGSATFATSSLAQGAHSITAAYGGSATYAGSTSLVLTQTVNVAPPAAPSGLTATAAGSTEINLSWTASSTSGVTYDIYQSTASGFTPSPSNLVASGVASTSYAASGLAASTAYYFRVTAVNAGGASAATNQASATTAAAASCHVDYSVTSQWNNGFNGAITIKNTGASPIKDWTLTWIWPGNQAITQSWDASYTQSGANVQLAYMSYNSTIAPGATLSGVGFGASYSGTNTAPAAFYVNGTLCH